MPENSSPKVGVYSKSDAIKELDSLNFKLIPVTIVLSAAIIALSIYLQDSVIPLDSRIILTMTTIIGFTVVFAICFTCRIIITAIKIVLSAQE